MEAKFYKEIEKSMRIKTLKDFETEVRETAKSVKSLGLKDNTTNQIRMKIY